MTHNNNKMTYFASKPKEKEFKTLSEKDYVIVGQVKGKAMFFHIDDVREFIKRLLDEMPYEREFIKKLAGDKLLK